MKQMNMLTFIRGICHRQIQLLLADLIIKYWHSQSYTLHAEYVLLQLQPLLQLHVHHLIGG